MKTVIYAISVVLLVLPAVSCSKSAPAAVKQGQFLAATANEPAPSAEPSPSPTAEPSPEPTPEPEYKEIGKFKNTHYYVVMEEEYKHLPADAEVREMDDTLIAKVSQKFKKDVNIEGTGKLLDGRVINYAGKKDGTIRYHVTVHPYGRGVGDCALVPFKTIAVDSDEIPMGTLVKIDETVGMKLPDGTVHDGLWRAEDVGGAIKKKRVDIFVGEGKSNGKVLEENGIKHMQALTIRLVEEAPKDDLGNPDDPDDDKLTCMSSTPQ